jgi:hypothetical protein
VVSGDGQSAQAGDPIRNPLIVEVLDQSGRPIPGAAVVFEFLDPPRGAEISAPATQTDMAGRASAEVTLGEVAGDQPVVARLDDPESDLQVQFLLTALQRPQSPPPPPTDGGGGGAGPAPPEQPSPPPDDGDGDGDGGGNGNENGNGKGKGKDHGGHGKGKDKHDG